MTIRKQIGSNKAGYSLLEMLFVVVCVGILLAMTLPAFGSYIRTTRIHGATNELLANLHFARSLAVKERRTFHIEFSDDAYEIKETASDEVVRREQLPPGVTCVASDDPSFYAWGLTDAVSITLMTGGRVSNLSLSQNGHITH